jgi:hypothetical protein
MSRIKNSNTAQKMLVSVRTWVSFIITFIFLIVWIGLFTGLNVPEIKRMNNHLETKCFVNDSVIIRRYCPAKTCSDCDSFHGWQCKNIKWVMEQINPDTCNITESSPNPCPSAMYCEDGHYCCRRRRNRCRESTDHHMCIMIPRLCYTVRLFLLYNTTSDIQVSTVYDFDTRENWPKAFELQNVKYQQNHFYPCFYNIHDLSIVRWTLNYTAGYWAASCIFAVLVFFGCIISSMMCIKDQSRSGEMSCWVSMRERGVLLDL